MAALRHDLELRIWDLTQPPRLREYRYRKWAVATYLLATRPKGISSVQLGRDLGIKQSSAWLLLHKLRETWSTLVGPDLMSGPVEVDEVYLGGREKNKHADKKGRRKKTAVVGIRDRETGHRQGHPRAGDHRGPPPGVYRGQRGP